jgi:uncharacterized protein (TIGR02246 family)
MTVIRRFPFSRETLMRSAARAGCMVLLGASLACGGGPRPDPKAAEAAIRQLVTDWNGYLSSQNDSAIAALYADDAVLMPPAMPRVTGRENIRRFWAQIWPLKATLTLATASIHVAQSGDWAIEEGDWTWSAPSTTGEQRDKGKYLVTWTRTREGWKAAQDVWNSDQPPPAPAPSATGD